MKSIKAAFSRTPKTTPPAAPKVPSTVSSSSSGTTSTKPPAQMKPSSSSTPPPSTSAAPRPSTPDKTSQGDAFKPSVSAPASSSSSSPRPNINAHELQGPQLQSPQLSESEIQDLALGRTPGRGKAAAPRPEIQQVCEDMKQEIPGAEVLRYTDQGGHPMLKKPGLPSGTDAGVCSAMTSEWIRTGIEAGGDPKKGSQAFGKVTDHQFGGLIDKQHVESLQGDAITRKNNANIASISKLQDDIAGLKLKQAQRGEINERLTNPDLSPDERQGLLAQRKALNQEIKAGSAQAKQDSEAITQTHHEIQAETDAFRAGRGGGYPGVRVQDYEPIQGDSFAQKLFDGTKENGHYRMGLRKPGEAAEGHVIGLHKTDGESRLMDANTAEWKTNNHKDLVNLTAEHIDRLYPGYESFDLTRYG